MNRQQYQSLYDHMTDNYRDYLNIRFVSFILMISICISVCAQTSLIEYLYENAEDADVEMIEQLERLAADPPNLNTASKSQLNDFPLFTDLTIVRIISERRRPFTSWDDFSARIQSDESIVGWIQQYFSIVPVRKKSPNAFQCNFRERFQVKLPSSRGFEESIYPGGAGRNYHRLRLSWKNRIEAGALIERDPGETRWNDHQVGYAGIQFLEKSQFIIGNYRIEAGPGLVFGGPYGAGKGADPLSPALIRSRGLRGYVYADESHAYRGVACRLASGPMQILMMFSCVLRDAVIEDSVIVSQPVSGLHRTDSETAHRLTAAEKMAGGRISMKILNSEIGLSGWWNAMSKPVIVRNRERNFYGFSGDENYVLGCDWRCAWRSVQWISEAARSKSNGQAIVSHLILQASPLQWVMLFRHFDADFQNPHGRGFGYGDPENETGWYWGMKTRLSGQTRMALYMDMFRTPWRSYFISMPTQRSDFFLELEHKISPRLQITGRWRCREGEQTAVAVVTGSLRQLETLQIRQSGQWRIQMISQPKSNLRFCSRFERIRIDYPAVLGEWTLARHDESGTLFFQDARFQCVRKLTLTTRWMTWQTDSYDSRVYEFENDLPGAFTNRALYGKGTRWYLLLKWGIPWGAVSMKYGQSYHDGEASWGSGYDEIQGDCESDFSVQVDINM